MSDADKIISQWNDRMQALADAIVTAAPQATKIALDSVRVEALSCLVIGIIFLCIAAMAIGGIMICMRKFRTTSEDDVNSDTLAAGFISSAIVSVIALIVSMTQLLDVWNWISLWHPELWIAHKLLNL